MFQYRDPVVDEIGNAQFFTNVDLFSVLQAKIDILPRDTGLFPKIRFLKAEQKKRSGNDIRPRYDIDTVKTV